MQIFVLIFCFTQSVTAIYTTPPIWISSSLVRSADANIISTLTGNTSTPSYTYTFSSPFTAVPYFAFGVKAYEAYDYLGHQCFQVNKTFLSSSTFTAVVQIIGTTNILRLNVQYIGIEPSFPHHINSFDNVPVNYSRGPLENITVRSNSVQFYTNKINYTLQGAGLTYNTFLEPFDRNKILLFMNSMFLAGSIEMNTPDVRPINLTVVSNAISVNQYQISVSLSIMVDITRLHFSMLIFDQIDVISSKIYTLVYEKIQLPYTGGFIPVPQAFVDNFIMGLLDFSTNKTQTIIDFQWDFAIVNGMHGVLMPLSIAQTNKAYGTETVNKYRFTLFYIKTWICPNSTLFDLSQDLCIQCPILNCLNCLNITVCDQCDEINDYFLNLTTLQCQLCTLEGCINCMNSTTCQVCNSSANYALINGTCEYCNNSANIFLNSSNLCQLCSISGCTLCLDLNNCIQCDLLGSYSILELAPSLRICQYCNDSLNKFVNFTSQRCQLCSLEGCLICLNLTQCSLCNGSAGYYLNGFDCRNCTFLGNCTTNTTNQTICGDNVLVLSEECDDGNLNNNDGCSQNCIVEPQFRCEPNPNTTFLNSVCYYIGQITLQVVYIEKVDNANQIQILLKIGPSDLELWDQVNFQQMITLSNTTGFDSYTINRNPDGTVSIIINYNQDIQNMEITVEFDPSLSGHASLSQIDPASRTFNLQTTDNESILFYDRDVYNLSNIVSILTFITSGLALLLFVIGMISGRLVGVQTMQVIQIVYLSLFALDDLNPCFTALKNMWFVNGFSYYSLTKDHLIDPHTPNKIKSLRFYSRFMENYNLTFLLILIPYFASFVCYIISKICFKNNLRLKNRINKTSKRLACYYAFNGVMFSAYIVVVSLVLEAMYGVKLINGIIGNISLVQMIFLLAIYLVNFVLIIYVPRYFGQFSKCFISDNKISKLDSQEKYNKEQQEQGFKKGRYQVFKQFISRKWYNLLMIQRFLVGALLVLLLNNNLQLLFPILFLTLLLLVTLIFKPYNKLYHNIRFMCNMLICIIILAIYIIYNSEHNLRIQAHKQPVWLIMPIFICALLLVCVIYNSIALVYQIVTQRKSASNQNIELDYFDQSNTVSKINKGNLQNINSASTRAINNTLLSPKNLSQIGSERMAQQRISKLKQIRNNLKIQFKRTNPQGNKNTGSQGVQSTDRTNGTNAESNQDGNFAQNESQIRKLCNQKFEDVNRQIINFDQI